MKLNVDEHPSIPGQLRIQSLPTVYAFRDGRPLDGFRGAQPESAVKAFIDRMLGDDAAADLAAALEAGDKALEPAICRARRKSMRRSCRRTART